MYCASPSPLSPRNAMPGASLRMTNLHSILRHTLGDEDELEWRSKSPVGRDVWENPYSIGYFEEALVELCSGSQRKIHKPRIDQCEDGWFETVCVDLAGVALDRINVKPLYDDREGRINRLIVYGNRPAPPDLGEKHKHEHSQIRYGGFCRVIYLEENVDTQNIPVDCYKENGILTILLSKQVDYNRYDSNLNNPWTPSNGWQGNDPPLMGSTRTASSTFPRHMDDVSPSRSPPHRGMQGVHEPPPIPDYRYILADIISDRALYWCRATPVGEELWQQPHRIRCFKAVLTFLCNTPEFGVFRPRIDCYEGPYLVGARVEIAGVSRENVKVKVVHDNASGINRLLVYGNRTAPGPPSNAEHECKNKEIKYGGFCRVIGIRSEVWKHPVFTSMSDGVFTVRFLKYQYPSWGGPWSPTRPLRPGNYQNF